MYMMCDMFVRRFQLFIWYIVGTLQISIIIIMCIHIYIVLFFFFLTREILKRMTLPKTVFDVCVCVLFMFVYGLVL